MKHVIRIGDQTSHGGKVVSAAANFDIMGKQVARLGDKCTCPQRGHDGCVIVEGDPSWLIDGIPVALEGHKTSCGAVLISSLGNLERSWDGGGISSQRKKSNSVASAGNAWASASNPQNYDQHFMLVNDKTGLPLDGIPYRITLPDGSVAEGVTDMDGKTVLVSADAPLIADLEYLI